MSSGKSREGGQGVTLNWLMPRKAAKAAVSFGTPWAKGVLQPHEAVLLQDSLGNRLPVQSKVNAYWPDGSVKWLLHSAMLDTDQGYEIVRSSAESSKGSNDRQASTAIAAGIKAKQNADGSIEIENNRLTCTIQQGNRLITSLQRRHKDQQPLAAELVAWIEQREEQDECETLTCYRLTGTTKNITLEEAGPLRAVVKLEGHHSSLSAKPSFDRFPFVVRLYFYADSDEVKIVHSFIYDGDQQKDFLKGLAVQFHLQAEGELWNRHIGFTGDTGMFYEAVQPMYTPRVIHPSYEKQQYEGQFVELDAATEPELLQQVQDNAVWSNFRLQQHACDHYSIVKSTGKQCAFIPAVQGNRAKGALFFGSKSIIAAVAVKDFWQKCPMALEIANAAGQQPTITAWLWSKYSESYDFRAYDTVQHQYAYGDINNQPEGIANTNELVVKLFDAMPGKQAILDFADDVQTDALLIAEPQAYEQTKVFGTYWCQPQDDRYRTASHENAFNNFLHYYIQEVEQRKWYGFWDYGDVMHTYDPVRHNWRYDVGGYAWQNTELCNTYVNWLAFLRTGDYEIYRFARAMTRHTSEVDMYHSGPYAKLGSRHNVRHWGCKWKEPRISMAGHHRFFYYLTGDERIGDIMDFVKDVDFVKRGDHIEATGAEVETDYVYHARTGPDWSAYVSNWMVRWERFQDMSYRDKIMEGINSLKQAPLRLTSGSSFRYDPHTGFMHYIGDGNYQYHMVICFGAPEIWFELEELIEDDEFADMLAQFGDYYAMTPEERKVQSAGRFNEQNEQSWEWPNFGARMVAYAGYKYQNPARIQQAIDLVSLNPSMVRAAPGKTDELGNLAYRDVEATEYVRAIKEVPNLSTNTVSQWSLNYIETAKIRELNAKNVK